MSLSTVSAEIQPGNGFREYHVGVSTVAPPVKLGQESACGRRDRGSRSSFLGRAIGSPKSVCAEIPSSKHPRCCPPCGPVCFNPRPACTGRHPQGFSTQWPQEKEMGQPMGQIELKCAFYNFLIYPLPPPSVNHLGQFFPDRGVSSEVGNSLANGRRPSAGWTLQLADAGRSPQDLSVRRSSCRRWAFSRTAAPRRGRQRPSPRTSSWPRCREARTGCRA
jgi:hypothetical protein